MMQLSIKLRDGFKDDSLTLKINGREVYKKSHLTSDLSISTADVLELQSETELIEIEIELAHGIGLMQEVNLKETPFLDIYKKNSIIELHCLKQEVPML